MSSMNVCILLGRLKDDPNVRKHTSGVEVATMTIEEVVVQRDRLSGNPVERVVHHEVRVYNPAFVQAVKAEGARGRHVEVQGQLSYGDDGKAYVAVPSQGGRVAFKYFEVREIPSEPPAVVADHDAARDLASALPEVQAPEPEPAPSHSEPDASADPVAENARENVAPVEEPAKGEPEPAVDVESRPASVQTPPRPGFAARPPQIGARPAVIVRPASGPAVVQQSQERAPAAERTPPTAAAPPPARPSVGSMPARVGGAPVAGVAQPRAAAGPRIAGPVTRPTMASRPAPSHPGPAAAVAGRPAVMSGGGIGRVQSETGTTPRSNAWRGQMDDLDTDIPF
jgi:single-stranded DNA-binding protein